MMHQHSSVSVHSSMNKVSVKKRMELGIYGGTRKSKIGLQLLQRAASAEKKSSRQNPLGTEESVQEGEHREIKGLPEGNEVLLID